MHPLYMYIHHIYTSKHPLNTPYTPYIHLKTTYIHLKKPIKLGMSSPAVPPAPHVSAGSSNAPIAPTAMPATRGDGVKC